MPRMEPPPGWLKGKDAAARLGISDSLLSRYVDDQKIRRFVPRGRKYGFYNEDDVRALEEARVAFPGAKSRQAHRSIFTIANRADVPAIAKIDHDAIHPGDDQYNDEYFLKWQQRNPETLFALRDTNTNGAVVGFLCILPLRRAVLDRFLHGEISPADFTDDDIPLFTTGAAIHLYIIALAIDPQYPFTLKHEYGRSLLAGFFSFLLALGERGVNVETITARSHTQDGIKLMRKLGLPWLVSPVPGMELFSVRVAESGMPFLRKYRAKLAEKHPFDTPEISETPKQIAPPRKPSPPSRLTSQPALFASAREQTDSSDLVSVPRFLKAHNVPASTVNGAIARGDLPVVEAGWIEDRHRVNFALDAAGRAAFYRLFCASDPGRRCPDCPHS